jgi:hypothetical protein
MSLLVDEFDYDYMEQMSSTTCPECGVRRSDRTTRSARGRQHVGIRGLGAEVVG